MEVTYQPESKKIVLHLDPPEIFRTKDYKVEMDWVEDETKDNTLENVLSADSKALWEKKIILSTTDSKHEETMSSQFTLVAHCLRGSRLLRTLCEQYPEVEEISFENISPTIMEKIVLFLEYFQGKETSTPQKPLPSLNLIQCGVDEFTDTLLSETHAISNDALYKLTSVAFFLGMKSLLLCCCGKIGSLIKGRNLQQITQILNPNNCGDTPSKSCKELLQEKDSVLK